jgi:neutral ceramidase
LFFNGCCGDVNHVDYRDRQQGRGYQMTQRVGYMLAVAALEARSAEFAVNASPIRVSTRSVRLSRMVIDDPQVAWSHQVLARADGQRPPGQVDGLPDELYARMWLQMHARQDAEDEAEVMVIRLGDVAVVGLPGEIFCETGLAIRQASPAPHTLVVELANDAIGYLPPRRAFAQGGYEPTPGNTMYPPGAVERLTDSAIQQLRALFASDLNVPSC